MKSRKFRIIAFSGTIVLCIGILFFLLRGPYLSNSIKRVLVPVFENVTQERVIIDKAVVNLFPFYVQVKGFKLFDKEGNRLLWITKSRAYIDLLGLLTREIRIRKLTLKEPDLTVNESDVERITDTLRKSAVIGEEGKYKVTVKNIQLTDGNLTYETKDGLSRFSGSSIYVDAVPKGISHYITVLMKKGTLKLANQSELEGSFDTKVKVKENKITVTEFNLSSSGSALSADGEIILSSDGRIEDGSLSVKTQIDANTINLIHPMKEQKDALLTFQGFVRFLKRDGSEWPGLAVDLKTDSRFYLESLMEILGVQENISGDVSVTGTISGTYPDIAGKGNVKLLSGVLGSLPIDELEGELDYKKNKFSFLGITARSYDGLVEGSAQILIPSGNFMVDAHVSGMNSRKFFSSIKWDAPLPEGGLSGDVKLYHEEGHEIEVIADVIYRNTSPREGNVVDRIATARTSLELSEGVLWLSDTQFASDLSKLYLDGTIDFKKEALDLNLKADSADAADLTKPYYAKVSGPVYFEGKAAGPLTSPVITGKLTAWGGSVHGIGFTKASSDITYVASSLDLKKMTVSKDDTGCDLSGEIEFRKAEGLFSFNAPFYKAVGECRNVDIRPFVRAAYGELPVSGRLSGKVSFEGDTDKFRSPGEFIVSGAEVYGQKMDRITASYEMDQERIVFRSVKASRGGSAADAEGTLFFNKKYDFSLSSGRINLKDLTALENSPLDMTFGLNVNGAGLTENPDLTFAADIKQSFFRGTPVGRGEITGKLHNKKVSAQGSFIKGLITSEGEAVLGERVTWSVNSKLGEGRYDFLLKGLMKDVPEDFLLTLGGTVDVEGEGKKVSVRSRFDFASISLYGYNLKNREDIVVDMIDNEVFIRSFALAGSRGDLYVSGTVKPESRYDLSVKGNMEIAPLKALSDKIMSLRGTGRFEVEIAGPWDRPEIFGVAHLSDTTASVTALPYKIGPLEGTVRMNRDRFSFDSVHSKFAGGDISVSGTAYLDGLSLKRLSLFGQIDGIKIRPAEGLSAELGGKLYYDKSAKGASLTGNVDIRKARYTKRIEWKSWLLGLKQVNNERAGYPAFLEGTAVNIHIMGDSNITIDNNIARTPVKISLNLTGTVSQKGLLGRIEASEGTLYFRSREFNILDGSRVDFVDPSRISPVFHFIADTYVGNYYVKLILDGTMEDFSLDFFSDPPLSEADTLALLTTGQTGKEARGIDSGIAAGEAAALVTGGIQDTVEEQFQSFTGLERFEIEPHTTAEGAFVPRVTVSKRLFENKLYVIYSTAIGTTEESIYKLEYKIDKNLSLIGSRNEIGSAGVDVKYRFEFK